MAEKIFFFVLALFATISFPQVFGVETYRAAVVEYFPIFKGKEEQVIQINTENYLKFMKDAKEKGADIIVFPESGLLARTLASNIPEPHKKIVPCDDENFITTKHLKQLSSGAKTNSIYVVVNLLEKRDCDKTTDEDCPDRGYYLHNTNVAFDRSGAVIARYSKFNLFDELTINKTKEPEISFFDTDFGVRFGTFTCFDILFGTPALQMVKQFEITDFVYPTYWFSELPFLTALQAQRGWAETHNVNLLASGVNFPATGSGGSGIYNGKYGSLVEAMPEKSTTCLLVADVPKIKERNFGKLLPEVKSSLETFTVTYDEKRTEQFEERTEQFFLLRDQIHLYDSAVIESGKRFEQKLCSRNNFCCNFKVSLQKISNKTSELIYRAVVSDGVRKYGKTTTGGVQCCGVVICNGPHLQNCTSRAKNVPGLFRVNEIFVEGEFLKTNSFQMPTTLTDGKKLVPLSANQYVFKKEEKEKSVKVSLDLVWPSSNLNTFAIFGRDFTRDGNPPTEVFSNASGTKSLLLLLISSALFVILRH